MSTDEGKEAILNPPNLKRISSFQLSKIRSKIIRERVMDFFNTFLRSKEVLSQFEQIQQECFSFQKRVASNLIQIEDILMKNRTSDISIDHSYDEFQSGCICISFFDILLIFFSCCFPDEKRQNTIDESYNKWKCDSKRLIQDHLKSDIGTIVSNFIDRTDDLLLRWIDSLEETIKQLSENRKEILANTESLLILEKRVNSFRISAKQLQHALVNDEPLLESTGML